MRRILSKQTVVDDKLDALAARKLALPTISGGQSIVNQPNMLLTEGTEQRKGGVETTEGTSTDRANEEYFQEISENSRTENSDLQIGQTDALHKKLDKTSTYNIVEADITTAPKPETPRTPRYSVNDGTAQIKEGVGNDFTEGDTGVREPVGEIAIQKSKEYMEVGSERSQKELIVRRSA